MKGCKFIIYNLQTEQKTYKPLIEIKLRDDSGDEKKLIVLTFN